MREYELTVVFSPDVPDEDIGSEVERLGQLIAQKGGSVSGEPQRWGRLRLAYPINEFREGNYVFNRVNLEPSQAKEVERSLLASSAVLRHLLVRVED